MSRELFMAAHEELIEQYMEAHPEATWQQAYDLCADAAYDHMREKLFDAADNLRKQAKEQS